jgi:hypothetical protein
LRDGGIEWTLRALFKKANLRKDSDQFELAKVSDIDKYKLIKKQGVKEIEFEGVLYEASASYVNRKDHAAGLLGIVGRHFKALVNRDKDVTPDALNVRIAIKLDRRFTKGVPLGVKELETLAVNVLDNQGERDRFTIVTNADQRIGENEIYLRQTMAIDGLGKSVERSAAWKAVRKFYLSLEEAGALETS